MTTNDDRGNLIIDYLKNSLLGEIYKIKIFSSISYASINRVILDMLNALRSQYYDHNIEMGRLLFAFFDRHQTGESFFNENIFRTYIESGLTTYENISCIDISTGCKIESTIDTNYCGNLTCVSNISQSHKNAIFIFVSGLELNIVYDGRIYFDIPNIHSLDREKRLEKKLPISKYKSLIVRHYKEELVSENRVPHWENRSEWKLKNAPETIFQKSLSSFLERNVVGASILEQATNNNSTNQTDITVVVPPDDKRYIFEIKWIGKSIKASYDGKTAHKQARAGISQLTIYLSNDTKSIKGILVVYDARKEKEDIEWGDKNVWDRRIDREPILVPLNPESASKIAKKRTAKN